MCKQRSLNDELLIPPTPKIKERLPKQTSLNESLLYKTQKEKENEKRGDFFQCFQRLQTLREEIRSRGSSFDKTSQKCQEKAESVQSTLRNGFARILQSWRSENRWQSTSLPVYRPPMAAQGASGESVRRGLWYGFHPRTESDDAICRFSSGDYSSGDSVITPTAVSTTAKCADCSTSMMQISANYETVLIDDHHIIMRERKLSKEENSDSSSKENSFQSDTSVDSEDSFVSVIFIPKPENQLPLNGVASSGDTGKLPGSPAFSEPVQRSLSSDSEPQTSPVKSPCSPLSPRSPNNNSKQQNNSRFFGPKFQQQANSLRIQSAHSFTTVNNGSSGSNKNQGQKLASYSTIGEISCAAGASDGNLSEDKTFDSSGGLKGEADFSSLHPEMHSSASLERLMKQAQKHKELEKLKRDAAALSARIQARISKFQESHPPPSPLFPSSFPSFAPKHTPGSLLGFPDSSANKDANTSDSSSDQELKNADSDGKVVQDSVPHHQQEKPSSLSPTADSSSSEEVKVPEEPAEVVPKKQQISCLARGENVEIIQKQDSYGMFKVQAVRRTQVMRSGDSSGEGPLFAVQVLEATTANVFNPELDDMDSDLTSDELTEVTEPESSSSYGSNTSVMNEDEWPPKDLDDFLGTGLESDERFEESDRESLDNWDSIFRLRSRRDRGSIGCQSSTDGSVAGAAAAVNNCILAQKDSSRSDEDSSSLTGVSSLSQSRYGDSSCESDNWSGGYRDSISDRTSVDSSFRPWRITEEYLMSRRGTAYSRWESFESTSSSETSGSGGQHRPSIGTRSAAFYRRASNSAQHPQQQQQQQQLQRFSGFSEDDECQANAAGPSCYGNMRNLRIYHDSSIEEENDLDCEDEALSNTLQLATNVQEFSELLAAACLQQAFSAIARNQARQQRALAKVQRRPSSQFGNKRDLVAGRRRSGLQWWASTRQDSTFSAFSERFNPPGAPALMRTRASIAGGKSFEFSKDLSGSAPTKMEAQRRSKKFSLPSSVLQAGMMPVPVPVRHDSDNSSTHSTRRSGGKASETESKTGNKGNRGSAGSGGGGSGSGPRYNPEGDGHHHHHHGGGSRMLGSAEGGQTSWDNTSVSTSQDSLQSSDNGIAHSTNYHRYYHVFRERELDKLIEKYVQNLHIISSYYDHANWCIIAEKVQNHQLSLVSIVNCSYVFFMEELWMNPLQSPYMTSKQYHCDMMGSNQKEVTRSDGQLLNHFLNSGNAVTGFLQPKEEVELPPDHQDRRHAYSAPAEEVLFMEMYRAFINFFADSHAFPWTSGRPSQ
ncbi:unnamed protein product [Notodromas monacha]|uniref:Uncharacterized protein n=1 Tax=Notodromas monacha TaxID=399045 RepID=A0A7R9BR88_9CRUS|nr:unnamed protein product [Notodromas monacha]CAG0919336.1 unnamed protein product [Notodromas monacha]